MNLLMNLTFTDYKVAIINIVIILILILGAIIGYHKGFLSTSVSFLGLIFAAFVAYFLKNPISVFLYTHLPFFKLSGAFAKVSVINILIYELIAFLVIFIALWIIVKVLCVVTGLIDKILSLVSLIGIPNKILGALVGLLKSFVLVFILVCGFKFYTNMKEIHFDPSLADDIIKTPVLSETFGKTTKALDEITSLAKDYKSINEKDNYNYEALNVLLKYKIIVPENVKTLQEKGKIDIENLDELLAKYED